VKIPHRPHHVQYTSAGEKITSFAGLKPLTDLAQRLGIIKDLEALTVKKRRRGIPIVDFVMSLVSNFIVGGEHLTDLDELRQEGGTRSLLYDLQVPAPTTAGETLRKFTRGHIRQLERVLRAAFRCSEAWIGGSEPITLDGDSSIFEVHGYLKEGARYGYRKVNGFHPLFAFWSERRLLVGARLRSGNRGSAHNAPDFLTECLGRLPADRPVRIRLDAGFYRREIVEYCLERGLAFSISAMQTTKLRRAIEAIDEGAWTRYGWEDDAQWAEIRYRPQKWPRAFRMLIKRTPYYCGDQLVLGRYFYAAVITNRRGAGPSLIRHHLARGGAENYIEEFKNGIGARTLPSQHFMANWAWLVIAQLAYNLVQWFKLLLLPTHQHSFQIKKLRLLFFCVAARIIRSGRRTRLALARAPDVASRFMRTQRLLATL
jgi:hypothetical protein